MGALLKLTKIRDDDVEKQAATAVVAAKGVGVVGAPKPKRVVMDGVFLCLHLATIIGVILSLIGVILSFLAIGSIVSWSESANKVHKSTLAWSEGATELIKGAYDNLRIIDSNARSKADDLENEVFNLRMEVGGIRQDASEADHYLERLVHIILPLVET